MNQKPCFKFQVTSVKSSKLATRNSKLLLRGFTIAELVMVTLIAATLAALAIVPASAGDSGQAENAGKLFAGMVEYAQSLAVARPDQIYLIKVDQANNRFWPANQTAPDMPLTHPI